MSTEAKKVLTEADSLADLHGLQRPVAVADELDQLRAFKAEIESQEPIFYSVHRKENEPSNAVCFNDIEAANKYVSNNYDLCVSALYAKPVPADKPDHWAVMSPGRADQYRAESVAVRKELGFSVDSDEVAPIDLLNAIRQMRADRSRITERDAQEAARSYALYCMSEARGDAGTLADWIGSPEGHALLNKLNADRQVPAVAVPDGWRESLKEMVQAMRDYEMDVGESAPFKHRAMMDRAETLLATVPSHSQQSVVCGYLISDGFTEQFVKTLSDANRQIAQRFNWDVTAVFRCGDRDWYASATCAPKQQPELAKYQPCGCVVCTCEHETQCQGCGAHHCGTHLVGQIPGPVYQQPAPTPTFQLGDHVRKTKGSQWKGRVVGTYSTSLTPEGYAVESDTEKGSVQIYPVGALELVREDAEADVERLVEALEEGLRAIGDHHAPGDCYATGPMTGDSFRDLVQCPACSFIAMCDDLLAAHRKQPEGDL